MASFFLNLGLEDKIQAKSISSEGGETPKSIEECKQEAMDSSKNFPSKTAQISKPDSTNPPNVLQSLMKFAFEVKKETLVKKEKQMPWQDSSDTEIKETIHNLLQLYIKEQIIKQYCSKIEWMFQKDLIDQLVQPVFEMLRIPKNRVSVMFEPYLKEIISTYLLYTEIDTFSRLEPSDLLIEITKVWTKIGQVELKLKRLLKPNVEKFISYFFLGSGTIFNRRKFFRYIFEKNLNMVNLIKIFLFSYRIFGEEMSDDLRSWIDSN